jgi:hypothetical protein
LKSPQDQDRNFTHTAAADHFHNLEIAQFGAGTEGFDGR